MGVHLEVQREDEVMHLRSRELQMENTKKLNDIIPIVETINDINLNQIENDTSEIKDIVSKNLEEQPNLDELLESMDKLSKGLSSIKGQLTKLSKKMDDFNKQIEGLDNG